ncbi:MAG: F0F1 ATP synthase subunit C [Azospirillum sp.]|nr:F0F1 ATP synthase subunit C [Azospirillum sp.]
MDPQSAKYLAAALAALPLAGVGLGIGIVVANLVTAVARNPAAGDKVFPMAILGIALTEAIALFALLVGLLILFI